MAQKPACIWALMAIIILGSVLLAGCTGTPGTAPPASSTTLPVAPGTTPAVTPAPGDVQTIVDAQNRFAADLYARLTTDPAYAGRNLFYSPFSISTAIAITYEGARGSTAEEIRTVFHFPADAATLRQGFSGLNAGINSGDANYTLRTANALWAEQTYPFLPSYTDTAERFYGANTTNLDFANQPEESRLTINRWVEGKTNSLIKDLIPRGVIDSATTLVITNAIYFKGAWVLQFDKNKTADADFHISPDTTVQVPMMARTGEDSIYRYAETNDLQVLELPYAHGSGEGLSMLVLLPRENDLAAAELALAPANLTGLQGSLISQRVDVYLPKFRLETTYGLPKTLAEMGMPTAFTTVADFSGMGGRKDLYISEVIHKAYVDVNEEGTEAAAATAVIITKTSAGPVIPVVLADHPFLFLIQDNETGAILFVGRVMDPSGS